MMIGLGLSLPAIAVDRRGGSAPVLDALGLTAVAAYSLRKVRAGYDGASFKATRSADGTSSDIAFGSIASMQSASVAFAGAGDGYAEMYDQGATGIHLTNATAAQRLRTVTAGAWLGGPSVVSGVMSSNAGSNAALALHGTACTIAILAKGMAVGVGTMGHLACLGNFTNSGNRLPMGVAPASRDAAVRVSTTLRSASPALAMNSTLSTLVITKTSASDLSGCLAYVDGAGGSTFTAEAVGTWNGAFTLGSPSTGFSSAVTILECLVLAGTLTAGQVAALDANMRGYAWT